MSPKAGPAQARAAAVAIVRTLRSAGHTAYFAGGCVRDELLGLSPTDFDIATDATPDRIKTLFRRTAEVGAAFGVVLVTPTKDEGAAVASTVEVATFRSDGPYTDRRRPDAVRFSDPKTDAQRRDFTINALFLDPLADDPSPLPPTAPLPPGRVIDYVGGLDDLNRRTLRAVGDPEARLAEDHLRALRAVRLAARLGFTIDPPTAAAIRAHARDLTGVSRERIGEEVVKMLAHASRPRAVELLSELGLDAPVLNEPPRRHPIPRLSGLAANADSGGILYSTHLAAWALDRGLELEAVQIAQLVARWRAALCLSNEDKEGLRDTLINLQTLSGPWDQMTVAQQKRTAGHEGHAFKQARLLLAVSDPAIAAAVSARVSELAGTYGGLRPEPWVTGDDLVGMGLAPSPVFKKILDTVYDAQLEGRVTDRGRALGFARELDGNKGV